MAAGDDGCGDRSGRHASAPRRAGEQDDCGYELQATVVAVADELASAAELVMGQAGGVPGAIVRGYPVPAGEGSARELVMPPERDLFR